MAEQVVTLPLVGGIDESTDTDQLKAPGMKELTNVVIRKKERFQKREGYALIHDPASSTLPANTYVGGSVTAMPIPAEAIAGHKSPSGDKIITIADGQMFEYVGQDAGRQYRRVNDVPRAIGDVVPVDTAAGPCLEIESCVITSDLGRLRVTVWTVAQRPSAILADDSIWWSHIDGAGLYMAIQREDSGAFVAAPYRVNLPGPIPTYDVRNLRVCESYQNDTAGDSGSAGCIVMWQQGPHSAAPQLWGMRVDAFGQVGNVINVTNLLTIGFQGLPPTYRTFDIAPIVESTTGNPYLFALAVCTEDPVAPQIRWYEINASSNASWSVVNVPLDVFNPATTSRTWTPQCMRGIVMQYNRGASDDVYTLTARVGVTDPGEGMRPIDMTIITFIVTKASGSYAALPDSWGIIRDMNYQTYEDFSQIPGYSSNSGKRYYSKSVTDWNAGVSSEFYTTSGSWPSVSLSPYGSCGAGVNDGAILIECLLPDAPSSRQLYLSNLVRSGPLDGNRQRELSLSAPQVYIPQNVDQYLSLWAKTAHTYPSALKLPVDLTNGAVFDNAHQLSQVSMPNCGPDNTSAGPDGYYAGVSLTTVIAGTAIVSNPTADVIVSTGMNVSTVAAISAITGLTNGTHINVPLTVGGNSTALATFVVAGGVISSVTITYSGVNYTAGAGVSVDLGDSAMYPGSPAITGVFTVTMQAYNAFIIMRSLGVYTNATPPAISRGACTAFTGGIPAIPANTINAPASIHYWYVVSNNGSTYSFNDNPDTLQQPLSPGFALDPQSCVHRWSSTIVDQNDGPGKFVVVGATSVGANSTTTPNGDKPLSVANVNSTNNYFEAYKWSPSVSGETLLRSRVGPVVTSNMVSALAGPWRMIGDMVTAFRPDMVTVTDQYKKRVLVGLMPAGDAQQRSQFLVYIGDTSNSVTVIPPTIDQGTSSLYWEYVNNKGMFVESMNAPRMLTAPLNSTRLFATESVDQIDSGAPYKRTTSITGGMLRDGSSENTCQVGAVSYDLRGESWRQVMRYADYTFVNGGVMSSFDGSSCSEACIMLWPQRDLCTIAAPSNPQLYDQDKMYYDQRLRLATRAYMWGAGVGSGGVAWSVALGDIPRPYYMYEAGLRTLGNEWQSDGSDSAWGRFSSTFGGKPTEDYQGVVVDQRMSAFNVNSSVPGNTSPGTSTPVTFYGKYGKYAKVSGNWIAWVPRNVQTDIGGGAGTPQECAFDSIDTSCDMLMRWVYEVSDGTGRIARSAPSIPSRYSVVSRLELDVDENQKSVWVFKYGFFAPRIELTNRLRTGGDDNKRITLQPYTTAEPYGSVFYRMPLRSWESPSTGFISERNTGRRLCPDYLSPSTPNGLSTSNQTCFNGASGEYMGILSMPYLYTTGGEVPNACPPSVRCMTIHQNRVVVGGADDATVIWLSKEITEQDAPTFSDILTIRIADGGAVTGLGSLSRALVVFKGGQIHVLTGDMPDNTISGGMSRSALSTVIGEPYRLVNGLGCISPRSVVSTPVGIFFQSSRTIELMGQNMAITPIGLRVMDILEEYHDVVSTTHKAVDSEVIFCLQKPSVLAGTNTGSSGSQYVLLVYNYADDIWSKHTFDGFGQGNATIGELNDQTLMAVGGRTYVTSDTRFYDTTTAGDQWITMSGETAPIALNQQQGYQRVKRVVLMGDPIPALPAAPTYQSHGMTVQVKTDWDSTQTATWTETQVADVYAKQGREFFGVHVRNQKCQKVSIRWQDSPGATINTGYGVAMSNIALTVGVKSGLNKRMTQDAEH